MSPATHGVTPGRSTDELVARCRKGDRAAQERVLSAEIAPLERFLSRFARSQAELEDLVQQTLARAVVAFPSFRGESSIGTWLARIGTRLVLDEARARRRRDAAHLRLAYDATPVAHEDLERKADARRLLARVHALLDELSTPQRVAFVLHVIEGKPVAEVAALMGASSVTTRARVFWARRRVEQRLLADPSIADALSSGKVSR